MPKFTQHELLELQEHIRGEAATSQLYGQFAQLATDPELKSFCEQEVAIAKANVQKFVALLNQGHH